MKETYGVTLPGLGLYDLVGKLIVLEGTDGVGRSTQIRLLKEWLEQQGHAVLDTGLTRSGLVGKGIKRAKEGHTLGRTSGSAGELDVHGVIELKLAFKHAQLGALSLAGLGRHVGEANRPRRHRATLLPRPRPSALPIPKTGSAARPLRRRRTSRSRR